MKGKNLNKIFVKNDRSNLETRDPTFPFRFTRLE